MSIANGDDEIDPSTPWIPKRMAVGHAFRAATTAGVLDAKASSYSAGEGGEGVHFYLGLDSPTAEGDVLVVDAKTGPKLSALRVAKSDAEAVKRVLPALRAALRAAKIPGVKAGKLAASDVKEVPGAFPEPYTTLITVEMAPPPDSGSDEDDVDIDVISAFVLADESGRVVREIYKFDRRLDSFSIDYLVDIGRDEIDDLVFGSSYYEGAYTLLLQWVGDKPTTLSMAGDGA